MIDDLGNQLGILPTRQALRLAAEKDLDLVEVQPNGTPPVCRIMDWGKAKYDQAKRERESRRNQPGEVKEVQLRPAIADNDLQTKIGHALRFLADGDKVKVVCRFKGREMAHQDRGLELVQRVLDA